MSGPSDAWLGDVSAALDRRIAAAGVQPDFLDVVTRAHELDPELVPAECIEEADALAPVLDIDADQDQGSVEEEARLDDWLGDVRAAVERKVEQRAEGPSPQLNAPTDRRGAWWIGGAVLAAAIVLVLGIGLVVQVLDMGLTEAPDQALRIQEPDDTTGQSLEILEQSEAEPVPSPRPRMQTREVVEHEAVVIPEEREPEAKALPTRRRRAPSKTERLKAMADQAQEHWRAGRRAEARRLFERIVSEGGRHRAVQMAYADLFTLASQAGDRGAQRTSWQGYLRRFPRGRFADDARAGLCRTAPSSRRGSCWDEYLSDFPQGSFRAEARAARTGE